MRLLYLALSQFLFAWVNLIDKFLVSKYIDAGIWPLLIISWLAWLPTMICIYLFADISLFSQDIYAILLYMSIWVVMMMGLYFYFKWLQVSDVVVAISIYQTQGVFGIMLWYYMFGELVTYIQVIGAIILICWTIGISTSLEGLKKFAIWRKSIIYMWAASLCRATIPAVFRYANISWEFRVVTFREMFGYFLSAVVLYIFVARYRSEFQDILSSSKIKIAGWMSVCNEILWSIWYIVWQYAFLFWPVAVLLFYTNALSTIYVFIFWVIITYLFPQYMDEDITRDTMIYRLICLGIMFVWGYMLYYI